MTSHKNLTICFLAFVILVFAVLFNNYYGNIGVHPIDTFAHLDSGYNILNGKHPIKDLWIISGILIDYIQALFFQIFGINFNSLVYHASFFNALVSLALFFLLVSNKMDIFLSFFFSISVAILCYPVSGTPFPYLHSYILSLISIFIFIQCVKKNKNIYWFFLPLLMFFSFFSMQMPSGLINLILLISVFSYLIISKDKKNFYFFLTGSVFSVFIFLAFLYLTKIPIESFIVQYLLFPLSIGDARITGTEHGWYGASLSNKLTLRGAFGHFKFIHLFLLGFIFIIIRSFFSEKNKNISKNVFLNINIVLFSFSFMFHQLITGNQTFIFSLIPILAGLFCLQVNQNFKNEKVIKILTIIVVIFVTLKYHQEYNVKRKFHDLKPIDLTKSVDGINLHKKFEGLNWISTLYPENPNGEIEFLKETFQSIRNDKKNAMVITHYQFFSFVLEKYLNNPNRWYFMGNNTFPSSSDNKYFSDYKKYFSNMLDKKSVERIYIIKASPEGNSRLSIEFFKQYLSNKCFENKRINPMTTVHTVKNCN